MNNTYKCLPHIYLVRGSDITIGKWVTILVNGVHGEARKHSQAHCDPQANHVHIQRPGNNTGLVNT